MVMTNTTLHFRSILLKISFLFVVLPQSLMLAKAKEAWDQEHMCTQAEKQRYLNERVPHANTQGLALAALQVFIMFKLTVYSFSVCGQTLSTDLNYLKY